MSNRKDELKKQQAAKIAAEKEDIDAPRDLSCPEEGRSRRCGAEESPGREGRGKDGDTRGWRVTAAREACIA